MFSGDAALCQITVNSSFWIGDVIYSLHRRACMAILRLVNYCGKMRKNTLLSWHYLHTYKRKCCLYIPILTRRLLLLLLMLVSDTSSTRDYLAVVMEAWLSGVYKCERVWVACNGVSCVAYRSFLRSAVKRAIVLWRRCNARQFARR